jgi:hypothetical protein
MISSEQLSLELHQVEREIGKRTRELSMVSAEGGEGGMNSVTLELIPGTLRNK